jgi:uncharacterized RDD family membrane protein YckC
LANCEKCGAELKEGAAFCQQCGAPVPQTSSTRVIDLAGWGDRIIAYLIDIILVGIILGIVKALIYIPSFFIGNWVGGVPRFIPWSDFGLDNLFWFVYFTFMDLQYGQSIGKMVMKVKTTNLDGGPVDLGQAAIGAFGKAFLLPIDVILGWIFTNEKNQRIFTYLAKTIVSKNRGR